jgi:ABC-type amino acid transport system permease subunit
MILDDLEKAKTQFHHEATFDSSSMLIALNEEETEIIKQAKELAATKAMVWPLFYTGVFYLLFNGGLTLLLGWCEKKLSYYNV